MTIVNVTDLRLKFKNEEAKDPLPELERPEPRNKQSNRGMAFLAKNVSTTCHRNTFNGAGFESIEFHDSKINNIDTGAFQNLTDVKRMSFAKVKFSGEINTKAMR